MKESTKSMLMEAYQYCIDEDKSMEFTIEYMQDVCGVDLDCIIKFLSKEVTKIENLKTK